MLKYFHIYSFVSDFRHLHLSKYLFLFSFNFPSTAWFYHKNCLDLKCKETLYILDSYKEKLERTRMKTEWLNSPYEKSVVIAAYAVNSSGGRRMSSRHMPCIVLKWLNYQIWLLKIVIFLSPQTCTCPNYFYPPKCFESFSANMSSGL